MGSVLVLVVSCSVLIVWVVLPAICFMVTLGGELDQNWEEEVIVIRVVLLGFGPCVGLEGSIQVC